MMRSILVFVLLATACHASDGAATRKLFQSSSSSSSSRSVSFGGGTAQSSASAESQDGGTSKAISDSVAGPGDTVTSDAGAVSKDGQDATAIAIGKGDGSGVVVNARAFAEAIGKGQGNAIAKAVADATNKKAAKAALVDAFALATNEGAGTAYADALAEGLTTDSSSAVFATAVASILGDKGCKVFKPTLAAARAKSGGKLRKFMDALDFDIKIAQCLVPKCTTCCEADGSCGCFGGSSSCGTFKTTPAPIWKCNTGCGNEPLCLC